MADIPPEITNSLNDWLIPGGGGFGAAIIYYLHGIRSSFKDLQKSIQELNTRVAVVIAKRDNDEKAIEILQKQVAQLQLRVNQTIQ